MRSSVNSGGFGESSGHLSEAVGNWMIVERSSSPRGREKLKDPRSRSQSAVTVTSWPLLSSSFLPGRQLSGQA